MNSSFFTSGGEVSVTQHNARGEAGDPKQSNLASFFQLVAKAAIPLAMTVAASGSFAGDSHTAGDAQADKLKPSISQSEITAKENLYRSTNSKLFQELSARQVNWNSPAFIEHANASFSRDVRENVIVNVSDTLDPENKTPHAVGSNQGDPLKGNKHYCNVTLSNVDSLLALGVKYSGDSPEAVALARTEMREHLFNHELRHCENFGLQLTKERNGVVSSRLLANEYVLDAVSESGGYGIVGQLATLQEERRGDAGAALLAARNRLSDAKTQEEMDAGIKSFDSYIQTVLTLREKENNFAKDFGVFNDHNSIDILKSVQNIVHKSAQSPQAWTEFKNVAFDPERSSEFVTKLALGSMRADAEALYIAVNEPIYKKTLEDRDAQQRQLQDVKKLIEPLRLALNPASVPPSELTSGPVFHGVIAGDIRKSQMAELLKLTRLGNELITKINEANTLADAFFQSVREKSQYGIFPSTDNASHELKSLVSDSDALFARASPFQGPIGTSSARNASNLQDGSPTHINTQRDAKHTTAAFLGAGVFHGLGPLEMNPKAQPQMGPTQAKKIQADEEIDSTRRSLLSTALPSQNKVIGGKALGKKAFRR